MMIEDNFPKTEDKPEAKDASAKPEKPEPRRTGQVIARGKNKWLLRFFLGRDSEGKRHYYSETFPGRKKDAEEKLRDLLRRHKLSEPLRESDITFSQFLDQWLEAVKLRVRDRSYRDYKFLSDYYIRDYLGSRRLIDVTSHDVTSLYSKLTEQKKSPRTIRYVHTVLTGAFNLAMRREMIRKNPMLAVDLPRLPRKELQALSIEDINKILIASESRNERALFTLAFHTGARPGEYLALKWPDLDFQAKTVTIQRSIIWRKVGENYFEDVKTPSSRRTIPLADDLVDLLKKHKTQQLEVRMRAGENWHQNDLIFPNEIGQPRELWNVRHIFKKLLKAVGLPQSIRLYDARHACATNLIARGINSKVVAERLGHSSIKTTLDKYMHVSPGLQKEASDEINKALSG